MKRKNMENKIVTNEEKKRKRVLFYTPKRFRNELDKMGTTSNKKDIILTAVLLFAFAFIIAKLFQLRPVCLIPIALCCLYIVPFLVINSKKKKYEQLRFNDINSYMSHMGQSFQETHSILTSLNETEKKYRDGKMKSTLATAISIIQNAENIREGEQEALSYIEKDYDCKKLRTFHHFITKAQHRGGDCTMELGLLEKLRAGWMLAVEDGYKVLKSNIMLTYLEAVVLLVVCAFVQSRLPNDLAIADLGFIQVVNTIMMCVFIICFRHFDTKIAQSLLSEGKIMTESEVEKGFQSIEKLDIKTNLKKAAPYAGIFLILFGIIFAITKIIPIAVIGLVITLIVLNIYNISYYVFFNQIKSELSLCFPEWVFDIILLIQKENVQVAIMKSSDSAPPVLKHELEGLQRHIMDAPADPASYLTFLERFEINGVEDAMRTLFAISQGSGTKANAAAIVENNMQSLASAEKQRIEMKNAYATAYFYLPILPCVFTMIAYGGALIFNVFGIVIKLLG